jgi:hypothetical protein
MGGCNMYGRTLFDRARSAGAAISQLALDAKECVAKAFLSGDSQRAFMAELRENTQGSAAFATVENYAVMCWRSVRCHGIALASVWEQKGAGMAIREAYKSVPKKATGRKSNAETRIYVAFAKLPLERKEAVLEKLSNVLKNHKETASSYEKAAANFTVTSSEF